MVPVENLQLLGTTFRSTASTTMPLWSEIQDMNLDNLWFQHVEAAGHTIIKQTLFCPLSSVIVLSDVLAMSICSLGAAILAL